MNRWNLVLAVFFIVPIITLRAQVSLPRNITISGGSCVNSILSLTTPVPASEIVWTRDGTTVVDRQTAVLQTTPVTVAGDPNGAAGPAANLISAPDRLFVDNYGNVYVPDLGNSRVQKWAPGATSGVTVAGGIGAGNAANQLNYCSSVFVDQQSNVYVVDEINNRVQKWAPGATAGVTVAGMSGDLDYPTDVFIDGQGNLYVSSQFGQCVLKYPPGSTRGIVVAGNRNAGYDDAEFTSPTGIFVDDAGNIYVCDTDNCRVMKWAPGATSGVMVAGTGRYGSGPSQLANPLDIYVDCSGTMYIADYNNHRIQRWAAGASSGTTVMGTGVMGYGPGQLNSPTSVFLDGNYNIYVSDYGNNRVQKASNTITRSFTATAPGSYTATVNTGCGSITSNELVITAAQTPAIQISSDSRFVCNGKPVSFNATATYGGANPAYQWMKNGINTGTNADTYIDNTPVSGDVISCALTSDYGCLVSAEAASNTITLSEVLPPNLGADVTICPGTELRINARSGYLSYLWQDGSTDSVFTASAPGTYYVDVTTFCGGNFSDTMSLTFYNVVTDFLPADTSVCVYDKTLLRSSAAFDSYNWSTGSTVAAITVSQAGWYWLQGTDKQGCISTDSVLIRLKPCSPVGIYVPEAFSPNGDGRNDVFRPIIYGNVTNYQFSVYNRQGQLVFTSKVLNKGWDGHINGQTPETNVYAWFCSYQLAGQPERVEKGTVILIK